MSLQMSLSVTGMPVLAASNWSIYESLVVEKLDAERLTLGLALTKSKDRRLGNDPHIKSNRVKR